MIGLGEDAKEDVEKAVVETAEEAVHLNLYRSQLIIYNQYIGILPYRETVNSLYSFVLEQLDLG